MEFDEMFKRATKFSSEPFPFQRAFAEAEHLRSVVRVPTGLGKTAMVVLGWLWRRQFGGDAVRDRTPRRLVYCLPMRVLVEQTRNSVNEWLTNLSRLHEVGVHVLMGGEQTSEWDIHPERDAILIGTQDMLLSRALNRGYGISRFRWPMHFGLLNNDCLWVFDEVQLMDVGTATSAQLDAFRRKLGTSYLVQSVWMSATLEPDWLDTVDFDLDWLGEPLELTDADQQLQPVRDRYQAAKQLAKARATMGEEEAVAAEIVQAHQSGSRTLAVFNTVDRASAVFRQIKKQTEAKVVLIHSRFRPPDREEKMQQLLDDPPPQGTIAVTTQVVEAGVDVSATTLFTELAPWASLVQRFGRCNRRGEFNKTRDAGVYWFDANNGDLDKLAPPYEPGDLKEARKYLQQLRDAGPASLEKIDAEMRLEPAHVIRRRDLIDLFDTTPDLAGNDIDISRFIRSGEDLDVQVFWRNVPNGKAPDPQRDDGKAPRREELCSVPVYSFRQFIKKKQDAVWRWNPLERKWSPVRQDDVYPGQTFLVHRDVGGYDKNVGWNPESRALVEPVPVQTPDEPEAYDREPQFGSPWQSIADHTGDVVREMEALVQKIGLPDATKQRLLEAARWHDWGKIHPVFQRGIFDGRPRRDDEFEPERSDAWRGRRDIGKAPDRYSPVNFWGRYERRHFRHELASALAMLQLGKDDLAVYLAAAHHGKVRLSMRSLPGEHTPHEPTLLYARGVWDGDALPEVDLGGGVTAPAVTLSLQCMQLGRSDDGQPSWAERMLKLRDDPRTGPFRVAYLEALLRAADMRASQHASQRAAESQGVTP